MKLENEGKLNKSIEMYKEVIKLDPQSSFEVYNRIGQILARQGKWREAIDSPRPLSNTTRRPE